MELKSVSKASTRNYAKKEDVSKKDLKASTPQKWIVAASTGIVTLFYSSSNKSLNQVGVVFGCIKMIEHYNYTSLYYTINHFMDIFYYGTWIFGVSFILSLTIGILKLNKENEKSHKRRAAIVKYTLIITLILAGLTGILVFILSQDIPAFYENGVKKIVDIQ